MITRICPICDRSFEVKIPSDKKRFCSHSCSASRRLGRKQRFETRTKIAERLKKHGPAGAAIPGSPHRWTRGPNKPRNPRTKRNCQECGIEFESHRWGNQLYCSRKCSGLNNYHPNRTRVHRSVYLGYQMDSGAELALAKILNQERIAWIKNDNKWKKWFPYEYNGKKGKYYPDFYLPDFDIWIEVKGRRYIRDGDDERRMSVKRPVLLFIANEFKTKMPLYLDQIRSFQQ